MRFIFVDAENVGITYLKKLEAHSILDRVFVFSKAANVIEFSRNSGYQIISGYPTGKNAADLFVMGHLGVLIGGLHGNNNKNITFEIHTDDKTFIAMFKIHCDLNKVNFVQAQIGVKEKINNKDVESKVPRATAGQRGVDCRQNQFDRTMSAVLNEYRNPSTFKTIMAKLKIPPVLMNSIQCRLVREELIKKTKPSGKIWVAHR